MAAQPAGTAPARRLYVDHDPEFEWVREEASDTLLVHLPEYKREHVKVQVDSQGNLRTAGERPLDGSRRSRFSKDFRLPENCDVSAIRAKFEKETLYVHLPKLIAPAAEPKSGRGGHDKNKKAGTRDESKGGEAEAGGGARKRDGEVAESKVTEGGGQGKKQPPGAGATVDEKRVAEDQDRKVGGGNKAAEPPARQKVSGGGDGGDEALRRETARYDVSAMAMELRRQRKRSMLNMAVAAMVLVGLGVYISYRSF